MELYQQTTKLLITGCKTEKCLFLKKYRGKLGICSYTTQIWWKDRLNTEGMSTSLSAS